MGHERREIELARLDERGEYGDVEGGGRAPYVRAQDVVLDLS